MKRPTTLYLGVAAVGVMILLPVTSVMAQVRVSVTRVAALTGTSPRVPLLRSIVEEIEKPRPAMPMTVPMEATLGATLKQMRSLFLESWGQVVGVRTFEHGGQDILLAKWLPNRADHGIRGVSLWDAPSYNVILFECDPETIESPIALREFTLRLLRTDSPLELSTVDFQSGPSRPNDLTGYGFVGYRRAPERAGQGHEFEMFSYRSNTASYVGFKTGKKLVSGTYPAGTAFLPERFPPLLERIRTLPTPALVARLGQSDERDTIVLREIVRRDDMDLVSLLSMPSPSDDRKQQRQAYLVVMALADANLLGKYDDGLRRNLVQAAADGPEGRARLKGLLTALRGVGELDFSDDVVRLLNQGVAMEEGLAYLEFQGRSQRVSDALGKVKVSPELEIHKQRAIKAISLRAGDPTKRR